MELYHGTDLLSAISICDEGIEFISSKTAPPDFGPGFYTTSDKKSAINWAHRKAIARRSRPALVTLIFDEEKADNIIKRFNDDLEWGQFVINNRNGYKYMKAIHSDMHNLDLRYDITCGRIADIDIVTVSKQLKETETPLTSLDEIFNPKYSMQYVFHTKKGLEFILKKRYRPL